MRPSPAQRFWPKVEKTDTCWLWTGSLSPQGYGAFRFEGRPISAHVWSYVDKHGAVPAGLELDHLCRVRRCVNPAHLEPVTHAENVRRGLAPLLSGQAQAAKTHCPNGHAYDEVNTYVTNGRRQCRQCKRDHAARKRAERGPIARPKPTHCKRGHEFTPENTYVWAARPNERQCRACQVERLSKSRRNTLTECPT